MFSIGNSFYLIFYSVRYLVFLLALAMLVISIVIKKPKFILRSFIVSLIISVIFFSIHIYQTLTPKSYNTFTLMAQMAIVMYSVFFGLISFIAVMSIHFANLLLKSKISKTCKVASSSFMLCMSAVSASFVLGFFIWSLGWYPENYTHKHADKLEPPILLSNPVQFKVSQSSTFPLPDSNDRILINIGEIRLGQVVTSLSWHDGGMIETARTMRKNSKLNFKAEGHYYTLELKELNECSDEKDTAIYEIATTEKEVKPELSKTQKGERLRYGSSKRPNSKLENIVKISVGSSGHHNLALKSDGYIVGWGSNDYDEAKPPDGNDYTDIAAGGKHSLALKADGTIIAWGRNYFGQASPPDGNDYIAISAGGNHSLALKTDGSIIGWGSNIFGQIDVPEGSDFIAIATGWYSCLALKADGYIIGWGNDPFNGAAPPDNNDFIAIASGKCNLALKADGSIVNWGYIPGRFPSRLLKGNNLVAIAAGKYHCLAITKDGSIIGWGSNSRGETATPKGNDFIDIEAGWGHSLALKADGTVVGFGENWSGQAISTK